MSSCSYFWPSGLWPITEWPDSQWPIDCQEIIMGPYGIPCPIGVSIDFDNLVNDTITLSNLYSISTDFESLQNIDCNLLTNFQLTTNILSILSEKTDLISNLNLSCNLIKIINIPIDLDTSINSLNKTEDPFAIIPYEIILSIKTDFESIISIKDVDLIKSFNLTTDLSNILELPTNYCITNCTECIYG